MVALSPFNGEPQSASSAPGKYPVRWADFVKKAGFPEWGENRSNAMRHSFGSYHSALLVDAAKTAAMLGPPPSKRSGAF